MTAVYMLVGALFIASLLALGWALARILEAYRKL